MPIMLAPKLIGAIPLDCVPSMAIILYHERVRNKQLSLDLPLRLNIVQWHKVLVRYCGSDRFLQN